jgi:hypothetical protein
MRWSVVVPGALIPAPIAADVIGAALRDAPLRLAAPLARAQVDAAIDVAPACVGAAHLDWLWRRFAGETRAQAAPVTAPYAWRALDAATPPPAALWQADPVHFAFARDHVLVTPLPTLGADGADEADEADALAQEAQQSLDAVDARLHRHGRHWFIAFDRPWSLTTTPLAAALGESAQSHLPEGDDAGRWRRLLTDVQIAWHHHPVNAAREARGAPAVNGLWLHGGGAAPDALPATSLTRVVADDPAVRGWAVAAGVAAERVVADESLAADRLGVGGDHGSDRSSDHGDALTVWPHLFVAAKAEAWGEWLPLLARFDRWLEALIEAAHAQGADVELVLCGRLQTRRVLIGRGDRWRAWRGWRARPLHEHFAERVE